MPRKHNKPLEDVARAAVAEAREEQSVGQLIDDMRELKNLFDAQPELAAEYRDFLDALEAAAREEAGHYECQVVSAVPLSDGQRERLTGTLTRRLKGTVRLHESVEPAVIGGVSVTCGDWRYAATVRDKLEQLTKHLEQT